MRAYASAFPTPELLGGGKVIDWKIVGPTTLKEVARKDDPGDKYEIQAHLYAKGWANKGYEVEHVAIVYLPAAGELRDMVVWSRPYEPAIADDALSRLDTMENLINTVGPMAPRLVGTADDYCHHCPYHLPGSTDLDNSCPGHTETEGKA